MAQCSQDSFHGGMFLIIVRMRIFLFLCLMGLPLGAEPTAIVSPKALPVKQMAGDEYRTLFFLQSGEKLYESGVDGEWSRVKVKRNGKWLSGYVLTQALHADPELDLDEAQEAPAAHNTWAFGGMFSETLLNQAGKSFQTDDEVRYTTSSYTSRTMWPALIAQYRKENFWRLRLGQRTTDFKGYARTDVAGSASQAVEVRHRMLSLSLERAFSISLVPGLYVGVGVEGTKTLSETLTLGGTDLQTSPSDWPNYLGATGLLGWSLEVGSRFTIAPELRILVYLNQSQAVYGFEGSLAGLFWF